ncbi:unnamed protein product [Didymodactylos carnosus]|uniref:Uncharacterized protein n=1 Tax=Didymodactylos carnosus TaxID=1234261 RepID=A0A814BGX1_9BILA|nr:unnamed protein product [Didymodactylos carnosus]CAF3706518.1 unnamed protein product [Didymodactylos carnosus]
MPENCFIKLLSSTTNLTKLEIEDWEESWTASYSKRPVLKALKSTIKKTTTKTFCSVLHTIMFLNDDYFDDNLNQSQGIYKSWTASYSKRPVLKALKSTIKRTTTKSLYLLTRESIKCNEYLWIIQSALSHSTQATGDDTLGWNNYDNDHSFEVLKKKTPRKISM